MKNFRKRALAAGLMLLCFLPLIVSIYHTVPAVQATILWQDGFESGNTTAWDSQTGTVNVTTSHVYTGTYSANVTSNKTSQNHYVTKNQASPTHLHFSCHYYFDTLTFPAETWPAIPRLAIMDIKSNGPMGVNLYVEENSGSFYWRLYYIDSYDSGQLSTNPPAVGDYDGLELEWNNTAGDTGTTLWVNGTRIWSNISPDSYSNHIHSVDLGAWGYWGSNAYTFKSYFDDGVLGDSYLGCPGVGAPTPDTTPPEFLDGNPSGETDTQTWASNVATETCMVSLNATDNAGLSGYFLSYSLDGSTWTNNTWKAASGTNTLINDNFTIPWAAATNSAVYCQFFANDTSNNWATSKGRWPANYLTFPICNATRSNPYSFSGFGDQNSPGSRRIFRSATHWVSIIGDYATGRIVAQTSRDGMTWGAEFALNAKTLGSDESACWTAYVWHGWIYYFYYNGSYSFSFNQTDAWLGIAAIDGNTGGISRIGESLLVSDSGPCLLGNNIYDDWPDPYGGVIYGYYSFSFVPSKDDTRLNWAIRMTGDFASSYARIYCGYFNTMAAIYIIPSSRSPYSMGDPNSAHVCVQSDPTHGPGFLLLCDGTNGWVYYTRYTGTAWQPVNGRTDESFEPLVNSVDWSTTYYGSISRTYLAVAGGTTYYFPDDPTNNANFDAAGPNLGGYSDVMMSHTSESCYVLATAGKTTYSWVKTGPTPPGWVEAASWIGPTLVVRTVGSVTKLSVTDRPGLDDKVGMLWGNLTSSYSVTFYSFGSARFILSFPDLDLEGCGNWVFVNERFYNWTLQVWHAVNASMLNQVQIRFGVNTRQDLVLNTITYDLANWTVTFDPANITDYNIRPVRVTDGAARFSIDWTTGYFTFRPWFSLDCLDEYMNGYDLQARVTDSAGYDSGWLTIITRAFKVYNKGGFSINAYTGDGPGGGAGSGINIGLTPFSFFAGNNSWAYNDLYYRDLVHIKMCPEIMAYLGMQTFYVTYGLDYCLQGEDWVTGIKVILGAVAITLGSERWWNWTVSWFNQGVFVKQETIMTFQRTGLPDIHHLLDFMSVARVWVDLWYDNLNGSTVIGGRVSAFEWPMKDGADMWVRWLNNNWGPMNDQPTDSMLLAPILSGDNVTVKSSAQVKMTKLWCSLEVASGTATQWAYTYNYPVWDLTFSQKPFPPLSGIQTPPFDPPALPDMPGGGLLGALFSGFSYIGKMLGDNIMWGGLGLWPAFVGFLDTIGSWLGLPRAFTNFINWISTAGGGLFTSLVYLASVISSGFAFIAIFMWQLITFIGLCFTYLGQVINGVIGFMTGTVGGAGNVWASLNLTQWVILGIIIYPIYLVILWDEHGLDAVEHELRRDWWVLSTIFGVLITIGRYILQIITAVIESIPVVE